MSEFEPGRMVVLSTLPSELLSGLPEEDQIAIRSMVGHPVVFAGYSYGQAEIEFTDSQGDGHSICVEPSLLKAA
jgi:hypothetical protein